MRTFVIGSKKLSVIILRTLIEQGHEVLGVYSRDDEPGMRPWLGELGHPSLREEALKHGIPCHEGMKVNSEASRALLHSLDLDVIFSCFWSELFKKATLDIPKMGVFNLHTAYLPKNRGSRPLPWAIIEGETFTGLSIHQMNTGVDNGPILAQVKVPILDADTGKTVYEKVTDAGGELFREVLPQFHTLYKKMQPQNEAASTYHPRGEPFGGQVDAYWTNEQKDRFRRAFHFPPFRAHREAPRAFIDRDAARVYLVPCTTAAHDDYFLPRFTLPPSLVLRRNDIGTPAERTLLKSFFGPLNGFPGTKGCVITGTEGLNGMYALHDVLQRMNVVFVVSCLSPANHWLQNRFLPQPFRYENGLLEIPALMLSETRAELMPVLQKAKAMADEVRRDVFVPVILPEHADTSTVLGQLSEEIQIFAGSLMSFPEVCNHFDTPYENIRT